MNRGKDASKDETEKIVNKIFYCINSTQNQAYIKTYDIKEPVVISQACFYTDVIAWIENTGNKN